ncbi:MAG: glycosyl transferase [Fibrobacteria bacterium]|nr:glycosyl transferase [Fibrobacteria bacterium]
MPEHFCTLFDGGFLLQGLALHASLRRHAPDSVLWVLCMDEAASRALRTLDLPGLRILELPEVETPALLSVKPGRSRGEYCWTLTSSLILHLLESRPELARVTYLDADLWFLDSPDRILRQMEERDGHTLLTPHDYDPEHDQSVQSGRYCVQFVPVRNTPEGLAIVRWWRDRCIEWCFGRQEDGKFGDQKYLDEWIPLFGKAAVEISDPSLTVAPWNAVKNADRIDRAVLYHFHDLRIHEGGDVRLWRLYRISRDIERTAYAPYLRELAAARTLLARHGLSARLLPPRSTRLPDRWRSFWRSRRGVERWAKLP